MAIYRTTLSTTGTINSYQARIRMVGWISDFILSCDPNIELISDSNPEATGTTSSDSRVIVLKHMNCPQEITISTTSTSVSIKSANTSSTSVIYNSSYEFSYLRGPHCSIIVSHSDSSFGVHGYAKSSNGSWYIIETWGTSTTSAGTIVMLDHDNTSLTANRIPPYSYPTEEGNYLTFPITAVNTTLMRNVGYFPAVLSVSTAFVVLPRLASTIGGVSYMFRNLGIIYTDGT